MCIIIAQYHTFFMTILNSLKAADLSEYESGPDGRITLTGRDASVLGITNDEAILRESTREILFDNIVCQDTDECFDSSSQTCKSCQTIYTVQQCQVIAYETMK